jgi:hypothetical protein
MVKKAAAKPPGRPSTYTQAIADAICARIADGQTLRAICREEDMPAWRTVYDWLQADEGFAARFARAREVGADAIAQEVLDIADTPLEGIRTEIGDDGKTKTVSEDMLGHRKLQIETRLKLLAKWFPKKYGEKVAIGGADDLPPLQMAATMSDAQLQAIAARAQS